MMKNFLSKLSEVKIALLNLLEKAKSFSLKKLKPAEEESTEEEFSEEEPAEEEFSEEEPAEEEPAEEEPAEEESPEKYPKIVIQIAMSFKKYTSKGLDEQRVYTSLINKGYDEEHVAAGLDLYKSGKLP